jgi:hypothetical protein
MACDGVSSRFPRCCLQHGAAIAPSTYYDARARTPSVQDRRDEQLKEQIAQVHRDNYDVYGGREGLAGAQPQGHTGGPLHRRTAHG